MVSFAGFAKIAGIKMCEAYAAHVKKNGDELAQLISRETGKPVWPTFEDGLEVQRVVAAIRASDKSRSWQTVSDF